MTYIFAVVGAITSATRLATQLEKAGCKNTRVIRTPIAITDVGCSYSVKIREEDLEKLNMVTAIRRFRVKKVFKVTENGQECELIDIS